MSIAAGSTALASEQLQIHNADGTLKSGIIVPANFAASVNLPMVCEGRLTLTTALPVTTADVTGATSIYFTPYKGNRISLYDGSTIWNTRTFTELTLALGTITSGLPYDVFIYDNAGTPALRAAVAWTNGTTRATALTLQNGVLVKTGATTDRYLGTFYTTATTTTEDSALRRYLWNYYNRVVRPLSCTDTTNSWAYSVATWQAANASAVDGVGRFACVVGWAEDSISAINVASALLDNANVAMNVGIGIDSITAPSGMMGSAQASASNQKHSAVGSYSGILSAGVHYISRLEAGSGTTITTWYGDNGSTFIKSGMTGTVLA